MKKAYKWETHLHTSESSACGQDGAAAMIRAAKRAGYHGVVVTDHFLNGNSAAPRNAPWQRRVDAFLRGYWEARAAGESLGVAVLLGCEFAYQGGDFLTYGVPEAFYRDQPDLADLDVDAYVTRVQTAGGLVSQAHPFRTAWYMPEHVAKRWDIVDAIEVFNGSHGSEHRAWDDDALTLAQEHGRLQTAGSDAHSVTDIGTAAVAFDTRFDTGAAFIQALRAGEGRIIRGKA